MAATRTAAGRRMRHHCAVPDCPNEGYYTLNLRMRRPDTTAVWAPATGAYFCDDHALGGKLTIVFEPDEGSMTVDVETRARKGKKLGEAALNRIEIRSPGE